jgi:hypothetical protein
MAFAEAGMIGGLLDTESQDGRHTASDLGRWAVLQPANPLQRRCRSAADGINCIQLPTQIATLQKRSHMMQTRDSVPCQHLHLGALRYL